MKKNSGKIVDESVGELNLDEKLIKNLFETRRHL
jgi:hypothetical protein